MSASVEPLTSLVLALVRNLRVSVVRLRSGLCHEYLAPFLSGLVSIKQHLGDDKAEDRVPHKLQCLIRLVEGVPFERRLVRECSLVQSDVGHLCTCDVRDGKRSLYPHAFRVGSAPDRTGRRTNDLFESRSIERWWVSEECFIG